jgi:transcriptional regulator with XRE-family HTH domain
MQHEAEHIAGELIGRARRSSGLTQAELARRAGMQSSVLSAYERGRRQPSVAALARIARAAGLELELAPSRDWAQLEHSGRVLAEVLDLADKMPYRPRRELAYPPLIELAS